MGGGRTRRENIFHNIFDKIIGLENLFLAWNEFKKGKAKRKDVQEFAFNLENNVFQLHYELKLKSYRHSNYTPFFINDPKLRKIHKACVRDRVVHQAIFRILSPIFEKYFIFDSYSCRLGKGTHRAVKRLDSFCNKASSNNHRNVFCLKCDIKRYFDSIGQGVLLKLIKRKIQDENTIWLIERILKSFEVKSREGLPLGNVTSQLFANIYLNELDQFIKRSLRIKYYVRYCDDFIILDKNKNLLLILLRVMSNFLKKDLNLEIHKDKIFVCTFRQGIDFLGYIVLPHCKILRTKTKKRIFRKINKNRRKLNDGFICKEFFDQSLQSYFGVLSHCNSFKLRRETENRSMLS